MPGRKSGAAAAEPSLEQVEQARAVEAAAVQRAEYRRIIAELTAQRAERERIIAELTAQRAEDERVLHALTRVLSELGESKAWKLTQALRRVGTRVAPHGTRRWRSLRLAWRAALVLRREGFPSLARKLALRVHSFSPSRLAPVAPAPACIPAPLIASQVDITTTAGLETTAYQPPPETPPYQVWIENNRWNEQTLLSAEHVLRTLPRRPFFSVIMPVYNIEDCWLEKAVASVQAQVYPHWELCIADDASTAPNVRRLLCRLVAHDARIKVRYLPSNGNISRASNAAAELARGEYLVFLDQDDELTPDCLLELASAIVKEPSPDIVYSDDDKIDENGQRFAPQFKPDWSPELLLAYMYFCHVFCVRRALFEEVGGFRAGFEGCQDYDLALRLTERTSRIAHVPKVLYHWRALPGSTATSGAAKPEAFDRGIRAVQEALDRRGIPGRVSRPDFAVQNHMGLFQIDFPDEGPTVAIVIPTKNRLELVRNCIGSILEKTTYCRYEIVVIDNESDDPATLEYLCNLPARCRVIRIPSTDGRFNYARLNNQAVECLDAEYVLFLNNDTEVRRPEWLSQMVGFAEFPGVGAVGARLLFPDGRVQHAGVITGHHEGMPNPAFKSTPWDDGGYLCYAFVTRNYSAVTAACLLIRRALFRSMGGYDETQFAVAYNDIDFCLRLREDGWRCVYAPRAELLHHESASRGYSNNPRETWAYRVAWGHDRDPYYNPNLTRENERFAISTQRATARVAPSQLPIRVLFCTHNLNLEGAPLYIFRLAVDAQKRGRIAPEIYSLCDGPLAAMYREAGIPVHLPDFSPTTPDQQQVHVSTVRMFADWIRGCGFDLVHGNTLNSYFAIEAAHEAGLPSLWTIHESVDYRNYFQQFGQSAVEPALRAFTYPYQVIFVAHATRGLYKPLETRHNFSVIHVGLKRDSIEQFLSECSPRDARLQIGCPQDKLVVTIIGTVADRKGQHVFASAAMELLRNGRHDVIFQIVGCRPDPYMTELEAMIHDHGAEFRLVPATPDVYLYYRASDIFVCCSTNESYPAVILEAMAFGLAIVTTPVFGIAEQIAHGISALTFQPGDVATLVKHLGFLLDNPVERRLLAEGARTTLNTMISHEEMIQAYEEIILAAFVANGKELPRERALGRRSA